MIDIPRLQELSLSSPAYAKVLRNMGDPIKRKSYKNIEAELCTLDKDAWEFLRQKVTPHLQPEKNRGWQQVFDRLNEAKGYNHLVGLGCARVRFIPEGSASTPDLHGALGETTVLCEIKTINISEVENKIRKEFSVRSIHGELSEEFYKKLEETLQKAETQMIRYIERERIEKPVRKIVYIIINFDDILHEYESDYREKIKEWVAANSKPDIEIEIFSHPSFYLASGS